MVPFGSQERDTSQILTQFDTKRTSVVCGLGRSLAIIAFPPSCTEQQSSVIASVTFPTECAFSDAESNINQALKFSSLP